MSSDNSNHTGAHTLASAGTAQAVDPTQENIYWSKYYRNSPYIEDGETYDDYGPAYRYAVDTYDRHPGKSFDDVEASLSKGWDAVRGESKLDWERAKHAMRDAWNRLAH